MLKQLLMVMVKFPSEQILTFLIFLQSRRTKVREFRQGSPHWPRDGNETNDPTPGKEKIRRKPVFWMVNRKTHGRNTQNECPTVQTQHQVVIVFLRLDAKYNSFTCQRTTVTLHGPTTQQIPLTTNDTIYIYCIIWQCVKTLYPWWTSK